MKKNARRTWMLTSAALTYGLCCLRSAKPKQAWLCSCLCAAFFILHSSFFISCSEEETEASEYDNWQLRNDAYFATLEDSLNANPTQWERILNFSLSTDNMHDASDYIYVKKLESGNGTESPAYTDSVRVIYQGRLIPTATYPEGKVFSTTVNGTFSIATGYTAKGVVSSFVRGFTTALQHMHRGDYWRIYVPYKMGYSESDQTSSSGVVTVPAYSTLIFDLQLVDFSPAGEVMPRWSSRERNL